MLQCEQASRALMDLILNADFEDTDIHTMYENVMPYIDPFVKAFEVARLELHIEFAPNVYDISGSGDTFETVFLEEAGDEPLVLVYNDLYMTTGTVRLYPRKGVEWDEQAQRQISTVTKLVAMHFSRANMVRRIERLSYVDLLTGLSNSSGIAHYGADIEQNGTIAEYVGCYLNLKNFSYLNEGMPDISGDAIIRQYALRLYGFMDHRCELFARLGGDNFFALVKKERLERFLGFASSLNLILSNNAKRTRLTIDSWIGVYPACEGDMISEVMNNAAFANNQAKRSHISVAYFDAAAKEQSMRVKQIAQTLPEAMRAQELAAFYQPKVSASTGELNGGEALVRWMRDGKLIPPNEFISAAEASGLITSLDLYMLEAVCRDLRSWIDAGIEPVRMSVNYSGRDFYRDSLIKDTLDMMRKYCIDGSYLEIEVTESSFFENMAALESFIEEMHKNGVKVSLDDFGTGYSSLNMLKNLDLDTVKLDKSFFDDLDMQSEKDRKMLQTVADMITELKKTAVSEGIESAEQIDFARKIGCEVVQGYYFDKPLSYDEFTARLLNRHYSISAG